jgi:hypothetical protein
MNFPLKNMPPKSVLSTLSVGLGMFKILAAAPASASWTLANRATYIPISINQTITVLNLFILNGATAANNFDLGIYDAFGTKIVSTGSTAQAGTNNLQVVSIAQTTIGPGQYYLAGAFNGTSGTVFRYTPSTVQQQEVGVFNQNTAFPLPANATFATATSAQIPIIGLATVNTV